MTRYKVLLKPMDSDLSFVVSEEVGELELTPEQKEQFKELLRRVKFEKKA